ncbi:MAG: hypothetical protein AAF721_39590 [Myxococcota bacterium]
MIAIAAAAGCGDEDAEMAGGTEGGSLGETSEPASEAGQDDGNPEGESGRPPGETGIPPADDSGEDGSPPMEGELAGGISIGEVLVNQAVDIALVSGGQPTDESARVAPIIGGRPALVRAAYTLAPDFTPRSVVGRLWLQQADGFNDVYEDVRDVSGPGSLASLGATFTWNVEPSALQGETTFRVEFLELPDASTVGTIDGAAVPESGFAPLQAWGDPMVLDLVVVPFSCNGGSVDVTPEDLADFEAYVFNTYPIQELNLEVHDVVPSSSCSEFDAAEYDLPDLRQSEGADPWVYYGGLLPGDGGGYSISIEGGDQMDYRRTFANHTWRWYGLTFDLFAHELGHNHGRDHTFEDGAYPGNNSGFCGTRSTYGWGVRSGMMPNSAFSNDQELGIPWVDPNAQLVPPTAESCDGLRNANEGNHNDFMSYAYPYWISAYNYAAIADRVRLISSWRSAGAPPQSTGTIHRVVVAPDGRVTTSRRPGTIQVVDAVGHAMCGDEVVAVRRGRSVGERFTPGGVLEVHEYATYEFGAPPGQRCRLEIDGLDVSIE